MPQTVNLPNSIQGINPNVKSVRAWFYSAPLASGYPQPPTPMPTVVGEANPVTSAHYVVFEGFTANNAGGQSLGRGSLDTGAQTVQDYYGQVGLQAILEAAFG